MDTTTPRRREARAEDPRLTQAEHGALELLVREQLPVRRPLPDAERARRPREDVGRVGVRPEGAIDRLPRREPGARNEEARPELRTPPAAHGEGRGAAHERRAGGGEGGIDPGASDPQLLVVRRVHREALVQGP
jgi:hypothetical protein